MVSELLVGRNAALQPLQALLGCVQTNLSPRSKVHSACQDSGRESSKGTSKASSYPGKMEDRPGMQMNVVLIKCHCPIEEDETLYFGFCYFCFETGAHV